jgi:hypothetical protein
MHCLKRARSRAAYAELEGYFDGSAARIPAWMFRSFCAGGQSVSFALRPPMAIQVQPMMEHGFESEHSTDCLTSLLCHLHHAESKPFPRTSGRNRDRA